jgi:hypothetical protein
MECNGLNDGTGWDWGCAADYLFALNSRWGGYDPPDRPIRDPVVDPPSHSKPNPCAQMAKRAQDIANRLIAAAGTDLLFGNNKEKSWKKVLSDFDKEFTTMYIGQTIDGLGSAWDMYNSHGGIKSPPMSQYGQQDFKEEFLDSEFPRESTDINADQVHHFAAFLSMGINDVNLPAIAHGAQDGYNKNRGDVLLGTAAHAVGELLGADPRTLENIGQTIRNTVCLPPGSPSEGGNHS